MSSARVPPPGFFDLDDASTDPTSQRRIRQLSTASASIARFASGAPPAKSERASRTTMDRARSGMREMAESGDWRGATPSHLVALYQLLHATVYEVEASELSVPQEFAAAASAAGRLLRDQFRDDAAEVVSFMRWVWKREEWAEKRRREKGEGGRRIGWRLQFGVQLLTDWRLDVARRSPAR
jgi:hypothetical protein